jgi:hypothetical protein
MALDDKDWDEIHKLLEEYREEHSRLVNRLIAKLSHPEDTQGQLLDTMNERNSVYGRDEKLI